MTAYLLHAKPNNTNLPLLIVHKSPFLEKSGKGVFLNTVMNNLNCSVLLSVAYVTKSQPN